MKMCLTIRTGLSFGLLALAMSSLSGRAQTCTVNWTNVYQRIDGFGASSAWRGSWTSAQADMFFSTNTGIGLSLLRNHITAASSPSASAIPTTSEWSIMQMARDRGALVWSAPWTPANKLKDNTNSVGGNFLSASNQAYASQLANYVLNMKTNYGVNLCAISVQNEPDANVSYESCHWSAQQFHDFVPYLYNALVAKGVGFTKIIIPEDEFWETSLYTTAMSDSSVAADVGIIANHNYDNTGHPGVAIPAYGKALWETEVMTTDAFDGSIANAMTWAARIHQFMTVVQVNAWHYWWLISQNADNEGLTDTSGNPAKRMYVLGQWSRFVRPNFYRIGATNTGVALISAYKDPNATNFAIVAVNNTSSAITQTFNLTNFSATSVTPWMTTSSLSLANQTPVTVSSSSFTYTLPAMSVVTFVGQGVANSLVTTTVSLASGVNPSTYGSAVTFTATVWTNGVAVGGISGQTVAFYDGAVQLGTGTVNGSGQAAYATSATQLSAATHSIAAVYGGGGGYAGSTNSPALSQTVSQATLTYTANAANMIYGSAVPGLGGSVGGFVGSDTQANATTGTLTFTTPATSSSSVGSYAINGSGLTANNGNYTFVQAAGNATALGILPLVTPAFAGQGIVVGSGGWQLSFSAQAGQSYQVLAAGDLTLPVSQWTVVTNGTFGAGTVTITDNSTNLPVRFYRIVSP
jgi:glucuronoarabinoxylan endo-1,4-beta-xylanase